ncbi:MAG: HAMP domain-containing histidine kinase [Methylobacteriaceae bacterium]|nr:HAMP domain-containing histidine kinase [Methylobacteriaceae bacterium]
MVELTAEALERGRQPGTAASVQRRRLTRDIRSARERLTSSTGLERAYEHELVRLFAHYHTTSTPLLLVLAGVVAAVGSLWVRPTHALGWLAIVTAVLAANLGLARGFLTQDAERAPLADWRRRFALAQLISGLTWALAIQSLTQVPGGTNGFVLFVVLMVAAFTAMLSATIPLAVYLGVAPLGVVTLGAMATGRDLNAILLFAMTAAALVFLLVLANRLYGSAFATIQSRAEKDAIFVELEQAKANSDEARRRAEEANLAKSRFLATMSHELRTPLNAILGFSEVMKNEVFGPHANASYKEYSGDIHGSGQHLLGLMNEILELSRIEAGRYDLQEEAVQLAWIVGDCRHMLNLRASAKNQTVREMIDPSLPRLWADERAVRQIVLNVLTNAIKFTPPGGEVVVKVGWTSSGGQYVSVKDTGPGIPEDEIPVVMSSFGRGSLAIKTAEQGSGLGLPIVKGLIDLHGGGFQLRSKPREGTEVIVTFPAARVMDTLPAVEVEPARRPSPVA